MRFATAVAIDNWLHFARGFRLPWQLAEPRRLYRQIADQIAGLIAAGEFKPGSRLPAERELATKLGVSRASVREAIISLEIGGLVEVRIGTGIFVTAAAAATGARDRDAGPGPFELLSARKLIEGEIAAMAAANASDLDIGYLLENVKRMESSIDDFSAREDIDRDFHLRLAKACGNGSLELVVEGLWAQRAELWGRMQKHFHTPALARQTIRDHGAIVKAIAARDATGARAAMRRHIARVVHEFERGLEGAAQTQKATGPSSAKHGRRAILPMA